MEILNSGLTLKTFTYDSLHETFSRLMDLLIKYFGLLLDCLYII